MISQFILFTYNTKLRSENENQLISSSFAHEWTLTQLNLKEYIRIGASNNVSSKNKA